MAKKFKKAVVGGTFDRLHIGHESLLTAACEQAETIIIGISTRELLQEKFLAGNIQEFAVRKEAVEKYCVSRGYSNKISVIPLRDIFGNALKDKEIQAVFVTKNTKPNAQVINDERKKLGFPPLRIVTIPFVKNDSGNVISSEKIRTGEIDRTGHEYAEIFKQKQKLILPIELRQVMRKPIGKIVTGKAELTGLIAKKKLIISVGDIVTGSLKDIGCVPDISVIDFRTRRQMLDKELLNHYQKSQKPLYANPQGTISQAAATALRQALQTVLKTGNKQELVIRGEEDLLTLPAILYAPLGSFVLYGQFGLGAVIVEVTEEKKQFIEKLLQRFN